MDLYREALLDEAERELRRAAGFDLNDWFRFEVGPGRSAGDGGGRRLPITAFVGNTVWCEFHVDITGQDRRMTGHPEGAPALATVDMPEFEQKGYRVYPIEDHVADKFAAIIETHGAQAYSSTRYKDLVDLVAIITSESVSAHAQRTAVESELRRRGLPFPVRFDVPDRAAWDEGYRAEAARSLLPGTIRLVEALAIVSPFIDPLLSSEARGSWNPERLLWQ